MYILLFLIIESIINYAHCKKSNLTNNNNLKIQCYQSLYKFNFQLQNHSSYIREFNVLPHPFSNEKEFITKKLHTKSSILSSHDINNNILKKKKFLLYIFRHPFDKIKYMLSTFSCFNSQFSSIPESNNAITLIHKHLSLNRYNLKGIWHINAILNPLELANIMYTQPVLLNTNKKIKPHEKYPNKIYQLWNLAWINLCNFLARNKYFNISSNNFRIISQQVFKIDSSDKDNNVPVITYNFLGNSFSKINRDSIEIKDKNNENNNQYVYKFGNEMEKYVRIDTEYNFLRSKIIEKVKLIFPKSDVYILLRNNIFLNSLVRGNYKNYDHAYRYNHLSFGDISTQYRYPAIRGGFSSSVIAKKFRPYNRKHFNTKRLKKKGSTNKSIGQKNMNPSENVSDTSESENQNNSKVPTSSSIESNPTDNSLSVNMDDSNKIMDGSNKIMDGSNKIMDDSNKIMDDSNKIMDDSNKIMDDSYKLMDEDSHDFTVYMYDGDEFKIDKEPLPIRNDINDLAEFLKKIRVPVKKPIFRDLLRIYYYLFKTYHNMDLFETDTISNQRNSSQDVHKFLKKNVDIKSLRSLVTLLQSDIFIDYNIKKPTETLFTNLLITPFIHLIKNMSKNMSFYYNCLYYDFPDKDHVKCAESCFKNCQLPNKGQVDQCMLQFSSCQNNVSNREFFTYLNDWMLDINLLYNSYNDQTVESQINSINIADLKERVPLKPNNKMNYLNPNDKYSVTKDTVNNYSNLLKEFKEKVSKGSIPFVEEFKKMF